MDRLQEHAFRGLSGRTGEGRALVLQPEIPLIPLCRAGAGGVHFWEEGPLRPDFPAPTPVEVGSRLRP